MYIIIYTTAHTNYEEDYEFDKRGDAEQFLLDKNYKKQTGFYLKTFDGWLSDTKAIIKKMKKPKTRKFQIYRKVGGTIKQPHFTHENVAVIESYSPDTAIEIWLERFEYDDEGYIRRGVDGVGWRYYYSIICHEI